MTNCIFCSIVKGEIPSAKIYEDDHLVVVLDIFPAHPGQLLIIPKEHKTFIWELNKETLHKLFEAASIFAKVIGKLYPSVVIYSPNGPYAGQRVPHAAIYIIPRQENDQDKVVMAWQREQLSEDQIKEWKEKIEKALNEVLSEEELTISSPVNNQIHPQPIQNQTANPSQNPMPIQPMAKPINLPLNVANPFKANTKVNAPQNIPVHLANPPKVQNNQNQVKEEKKNVHEDIDKKLEIIKKWLKKEI